jgi:hypothetical protein
VALHGLNRIAEAEIVFHQATKYFPNDVRAWLNLGEMQNLNLKFNLSVISFERAYNEGGHFALARLLAAKGWCTSWQGFEFVVSELEKQIIQCKYTLHKNM